MIWDLFFRGSLVSFWLVLWSQKLKLDLIIKEDNRLLAVHWKDIKYLEPDFLYGPK